MNRWMEEADILWSVFSASFPGLILGGAVTYTAWYTYNVLAWTWTYLYVILESVFFTFLCFNRFYFVPMKREESVLLHYDKSGKFERGRNITYGRSYNKNYGSLKTETAQWNDWFSSVKAVRKQVLEEEV